MHLRGQHPDKSRLGRQNRRALRSATRPSLSRSLPIMLGQVQAKAPGKAPASGQAGKASTVKDAAKQAKADQRARQLKYAAFLHRMSLAAVKKNKRKRLAMNVAVRQRLFCVALANRVRATKQAGGFSLLGAASTE